MTTTRPVRDVIIVGGGAAGLMAAVSAGRRGCDVLLLEKNSKLGVKILMSGGTRCNITHNCDARGIADAFGRQGKFLRSALAALGPEDVIAEVEAQGVKTKAEETGKIFPVSNKAIDVRDALARMARGANAEVQTQQSVAAVDLTESESGDSSVFEITTSTDTYLSRKLILTTGGQSYPGCGTTGDGYPWARRFGHKIVATVPALAPLTCDNVWVHELSGMTVEDVSLELRPTSRPDIKRPKKPLDSGRGPLLMTHFGFSGPTAMNLSRTVARHEAEMQGRADTDPLVLHCDFIPQVSEASLLEQLQTGRQKNGKQPVARFVSHLLPRRLTESLLLETGVPAERTHADLTKSETARLITAIKRTEVPIRGTLGYKKAEVTAGGVSLKEVNSSTMESRQQPGLYFAGEILDLDGPIGGFNFQAAFSTGWLAGRNI